MHNSSQKYCLDTNFFIEAWNKYYSPEFCESYWDVIDSLAREGVVFVTREVKKEIDEGDDNLKEWFRDKEYMIRSIDQKVQRCLRTLYRKNKSHEYLANNIRNRSRADPWVIAHAMAENAVVVTKEYLANSPNIQRIKIPDVCENMNVRWINDFDFIRELNIKFFCETE